MKGELARVKIITPNRIIVIKGKQARTPVEFVIPKRELGTIRTFILSEGIRDYEIEDVVEPEDFEDFEEGIFDEIVVDEAEKERSETTLDRLLKS